MKIKNKIINFLGLTLFAFSVLFGVSKLLDYSSDNRTQVHAATDNLDTMEFEAFNVTIDTEKLGKPYPGAVLYNSDKYIITTNDSTDITLADNRVGKYGLIYGNNPLSEWNWSENPLNTNSIAGNFTLGDGVYAGYLATFHSYNNGNERYRYFTENTEVNVVDKEGNPITEGVYTIFYEEGYNKYISVVYDLGLCEPEPLNIIDQVDVSVSQDFIDSYLAFENISENLSNAAVSNEQNAKYTFGNVDFKYYNPTTETLDSVDLENLLSAKYTYYLSVILMTGEESEEAFSNYRFASDVKNKTEGCIVTPVWADDDGNLTVIELAIELPKLEEVSIEFTYNEDYEPTIDELALGNTVPQYVDYEAGKGFIFPASNSEAKVNGEIGIVVHQTKTPSDVAMGQFLAPGSVSKYPGHVFAVAMFGPAYDVTFTEDMEIVGIPDSYSYEVVLDSSRTYIVIYKYLGRIEEAPIEFEYNEDYEPTIDELALGNTVPQYVDYEAGKGFIFPASNSEAKVDGSIAILVHETKTPVDVIEGQFLAPGSVSQYPGHVFAVGIFGAGNDVTFTEDMEIVGIPDSYSYEVVLDDTINGPHILIYKYLGEIKAGSVEVDYFENLEPTIDELEIGKIIPEYMTQDSSGITSGIFMPAASFASKIIVQSGVCVYDTKTPDSFILDGEVLIPGERNTVSGYVFAIAMIAPIIDSGFIVYPNMEIVGLPSDYEYQYLIHDENPELSHIIVYKYLGEIEEKTFIEFTYNEDYEPTIDELALGNTVPQYVDYEAGKGFIFPASNSESKVNGEIGIVVHQTKTPSDVAMGQFLAPGSVSKYSGHVFAVGMFGPGYDVTFTEDMEIVGIPDSYSYQVVLDSSRTYIVIYKYLGELKLDNLNGTETEIKLSNVLTYNGQAQTQEVVVKYNGVTLVKDVDYTVSGNVNTNAGTYKLTIAGIGSYEGSVEVDYVIAKATYDMSGITFNNVTVTYDGNEHEAVLEGTLPSGVTVSYTSNKGTNAGTYNAVATFTYDTANYNVVQDMNATLTINKATHDMSGITFEDVTVTYDGQEHEVVLDGILPSGVEVTYTTNKGTNAGTYNAVATFTYDTVNYNVIENKTATLTINKATHNMSGISFNDVTVTYDGKEHVVEITGTLPSGVTVAYENNKATNAGVYNAVATFTYDTVNYNAISSMEATLVIKQVELKNESEIEEGRENDVIVSAPEGIDPTKELFVELVEMEESDKDLSAFLEKGERVAVAYDVKLFKDGAEVQPDGTLKIKILIPQELRNRNFSVMHIHNDTEKSMLEYQIEGDYVVVETDKLSEFAFVYKTGSILWLVIVLGVLTLLEGGLLVYLLNLRKKQKLNKVKSVYPPFIFGMFIPAWQIVMVIILIIAVAVLAVVDVILAISLIKGKEKDEVKEEVKEEIKEDKKEDIEKPLEDKEDDDDDVIKVWDEEKQTYTVIRIIKSFEARLIQSNEEIKGYYDVIKNELLSYKKVKSKISFKHESFKFGKNCLAKLKYRGKTLCLYLALDPKSYENTKYKVEDMSNILNSSDVPTMYRIHLPRRVNYAKELIKDVMNKIGIEKTEVEPINYSINYPHQTNEELIEKGLIKKLVKEIKN